MTQSNQTVLFIFGITILLGMGLGMLWDILKILSQKWRRFSFVPTLCDCIFWIVTTIAVFLTLVYINDGALRFFEMLGIFLGIILHFSAFSRLFRKFFLFFVNIFTKICIFLLTPVKIFLKMFYRLFYILCIIPVVYLLDKTKKLFNFVKYETKKTILFVRKI